MPDILDEAAQVAEVADAIAQAKDIGEWIAQFAAMMAQTPDYQFVFLVAGPVDDNHSVFRQISNSSPQGVAWMLNLAGHELLRRYSESNDLP